MRPKSLSAEILIRGRASGLSSMPLREAARRAGAGSPFCILMLPSKSFYLSLPVVKEHPAPSKTAVGKITGWWAHLDSNQGPLPYQRSALTN